MGLFDTTPCLESFNSSNFLEVCKLIKMDKHSVKLYARRLAKFNQKSAEFHYDSKRYSVL